MTQTCVRCQQPYDLTNFKTRLRKKGLVYDKTCKVCRLVQGNATRRRRRGTNPDKAHAQDRQAYLQKKAKDPAGFRAKRRINKKRWQRNNPEKMRAEWRLAHARKRLVRNAKRAIRARAWRLAHPEEARMHNRTSYRKHWAYHQAHRRAWRLAHPQAAMRRYYARHEHYRLLVRLNNQRRRARMREMAWTLSAAQWAEILLVFRQRCAYCQRPGTAFEQEHLTPVVAQGPYTLHNIVPACPTCNRRKGSGALPVPVQPLLLTVAPPYTPTRRRVPQPGVAASPPAALPPPGQLLLL